MRRSAGPSCGTSGRFKPQGPHRATLAPNPILRPPSKPNQPPFLPMTGTLHQCPSPSRHPALLSASWFPSLFLPPPTKSPIHRQREEGVSGVDLRGKTISMGEEFCEFWMRGYWFPVQEQSPGKSAEDVNIWTSSYQWTSPLPGVARRAEGAEGITSRHHMVTPLPCSSPLHLLRVWGQVPARDTFSWNVTPSDRKPSSETEK